MIGGNIILKVILSFYPLALSLVYLSRVFFGISKVRPTTFVFTYEEPAVTVIPNSYQCWDGFRKYGRGWENS